MSSRELTAPPYNTYQAADWLRGQHPWLDELVTRVCDPADDNPEWLDELMEAFNDIQAHGSPPCATRRGQGERVAGSRSEVTTAAARALAPMSSGEIRLLRLMTTLSADRCELSWHLDDLSFDERGQAVVKDWTAIVLGQLPQATNGPIRHDSERGRPSGSPAASPDL